MNFDYLTVNFNSTADIEALTTSISKALPKGQSARLYITDNSGNLKGKISNPPTNIDRRIISGHGNVGFAKGNNIGIERSKRESSASHLIVINPDARLPRNAYKDLLSKESIAILKNNQSIALNIKGTTPYLSNYTPLEVCFPYLKRLNDKRNYRKIRNLTYTDAYRFHGCALIINKDTALTPFFDPNTFLYFEEDIYAHRTKKRIPLLLKPEIEHASGTSTKDSSFKLKYQFLSESLYYFVRNYSNIPPLASKIIVPISTLLKILRNA